MGKNNRDRKRQKISAFLVLFVTFAAVATGWSLHSYFSWKYGGHTQVTFVRVLIDITKEYQIIIAVIGSLTTLYYIVKRVTDIFFEKRHSDKEDS
jgi:hypothetical protein